MPFTYRDKPKLADRFRGKSGEEILNELQSGLDPERRMFFDSPSRRTRHNNSARFPRGFPFDDDRNRTDIRTYLDEIAARHPEFADQLREPPWGEDFDNSFVQKQRGPSSGAEEFTLNEPSGSNQSPQTPEVKKKPRQNLMNFGLRNTVPLGPKALVEEERRQRSMSAPPDNRGVDQPKKFVTKCEIPIMNDPKQESSQPKTELPNKGVQEPPQQKMNNTPNVRVIPIQVEGRDTPIVNTNVDTASNFGGETFRDSSFEGRLPRDFGTYQRHSPRFTHKERKQIPSQFQYAPQYQQYAPPHQPFMPFHQPQFMSQQQFVPPQQKQAFGHQPQFSQKPPASPPQPHPHQYPQQQPPPQHQEQQPYKQQPPTNCKPHPGDDPDSKPPSQPKPEPIKDPIEKVQVIQKEVEELMKQVESFKGNSRSDKQYLMLDELLTRQLLLLDNIDTEGKDNVRQARKDAIRSIQRCISTLENKVPLTENKELKVEGIENQDMLIVEEPETPQAMEVDQTKENTPVDSKENQKMDVDDKEKESQQEEPQEQQEQQPVQEQKKKG